MTHSDPQPATASQDTEVRRRILDSAERLFAQRGFDSASVRDITTAAKCNIAAVNYHFGSKENLYQQVFEKHLEVLRERRIAGIRRIVAEKGEDLTLEQLLEAFAAAFLDPILDRNRGRTLIRLMMREMTDPRLPETLFFDEVIHPVLQVLRDAIIQIRPELDSLLVQKCIHSLIGQLIHIVQIHDYLDRAKQLNAPGMHLHELINHVVTFTANGIRAYSQPVAVKRSGDGK